MDNATWENLLSLCHQDYEVYELLIGTIDERDPVVPTLRRLAGLYPDLVRLFIGLAPRGPNPKDSILSYLLEAARHDVVVFVDSDIRAMPGYLETVTVPLAEPSVGLVTCVYADRQPRSATQAIASLGRCLDFIPGFLLGRALGGGLRFAVGVTLASRKPRLAAAGGIHVDRIGSDYNLGRRMAEAGYRVELSPKVLDWSVEGETLRQLFDRELRWARSIRFNHGAPYYGMALCYGTIYCIPLMLLSRGACWSIALAALAFAVRIAQSMVCFRAFDCRRLWRWLWLLPTRDLLSFAVWLGGSYGRTVSWRGQRFKVRADGLISEFPTEHPPGRNPAAGLLCRFAQASRRVGQDPGNTHVPALHEPRIAHSSSKENPGAPP